MVSYTTMVVKNIIFDIGNVLLRWDPFRVVGQFFPPPVNSIDLTKKLFKSNGWFDLNLGRITEAQLVEIYHQQLGIEIDLLVAIMKAIKESLLPIPGSFDLFEKLYQAQIPLYALTDNTKEIVDFLRVKYQFWDKFKGIVVSADIGLMKPSPDIYEYILTTYQLKAEETLFIDDYPPNIEGAKKMSIQTIQFETPAQCISELREYQVNF